MEGDVCGCRAGGVGGFLIFQQGQITQLYAHKHRRKPTHCPEELFFRVSVCLCLFLRHKGISIRHGSGAFLSKRCLRVELAQGSQDSAVAAPTFGSTGMVAAADVVNVQQQLRQDMADVIQM